MGNTHDQRFKSFRFLDLPAELRNIVYAKLLCSFKESPRDSEDVLHPAPRTLSTRSIDTAILATCTQIHREAYDVMFKTNRLIQVCCTDHRLLELVLRSSRTPTVSTSGGRISECQGFALQVNLQISPEHPTPPNFDERLPAVPQTVVILGRDFASLCLGINTLQCECNNDQRTLIVRIDVAPVLEEDFPRYKTSLKGYFTQHMEEMLLRPVLQNLRGIKHIVTHGYVTSNLVDSVSHVVAQHEYTDPEATANELTNLGQRGQKEYVAGNIEGAYKIWSDAKVVWGRIYGGSSWPSLSARGGVRFVEEIALAYFSISLWMMCGVFKLHGSIMSGPTYPVKHFLLIHKCIEDAEKTLEFGFWGEPYGAWEPVDYALGYLRYSQALVVRLKFGPGRPAAFQFLNEALDLVPDEVLFQEEWQANL